jgi:hypothetical protein
MNSHSWARRPVCAHLAKIFRRSYFAVLDFPYILPDILEVTEAVLADQPDPLRYCLLAGWVAPVDLWPLTAGSG